LAKTFDRVAGIYDATRKYPEDIMDTILNALEKVLQKEGRILDAGVGTGRFAQPLQLRGYEVVGIDVSPRMLAKAVGKGTQDLIKGDVCFLPFKDESFRVTLSVHVMHLISSWRCALGEIGRVTTDSLVSVAFAKEESAAEDLRSLYDKACKEAGFELRHPGLRERELTEILAPDFSNTITVHEHLVDAQELIDEYQDKAFSNQWDVPDDIHEQAMAALKEQYEGVEDIIGKERISLIRWKADKLRQFLPSGISSEDSR
jgi:SAM-dependent methyltransferase